MISCSHKHGVIGTGRLANYDEFGGWPSGGLQAVRRPIDIITGVWEAPRHYLFPEQSRIESRGVIRPRLPDVPIASIMAAIFAASSASSSATRWSTEESSRCCPAVFAAFLHATTAQRSSLRPHSLRLWIIKQRSPHSNFLHDIARQIEENIATRNGATGSCPTGSLSLEAAAEVCCPCICK